MHTEKWIDQLRATLDYLNSGDIAEEHRKTLMRATEAALLDATEELERHQSTENDGKQWKDAEIEALRGCLMEGGMAKNYQTADDNLATASARLKRSEKAVKRKAIELGLGAHVNYWLARGRLGLE
jgi:hypothetical protein